MKYLINVKDFTKRYKKEEVFIKSLVISKRVTLIVGENGAGKSTILRAIGGFIKYEGDIKVNGKISYMSEFSHFPVDLKVNEFINSLKHISSDTKSDEELKDLFKLFNLEDKLDLLLSSLSKGMKAKLNLIQCLMENKDIYILDEPISGLDKDGVKSLIKYIKKSLGNYIISTHLLDDFKDISNEVIYL